MMITNSKRGLLHFLRWRDLIVVVIGLGLGTLVKLYYTPHEPSDYEKWQVRPPIASLEASAAKKLIEDDTMPLCFFVTPRSARNQPAIPGVVSRCLPLIPDGKKLDVFEVHLYGAIEHVKTDLYVPGVIPIAFTRITEPLEDMHRSYEIYLSHVYEPTLSGDRLPYTFLDWRLPDGRSIHYLRISPGGNFADALYESQSHVAPFSRSRVKWNGWGWDLTLSDGTTWLSPEAYGARRPQQGSLVGIFDKDGNEVKLTRKGNGSLTRIEGPSGSVTLRYDWHGRVIEGRDSAGNVAQYGYDSVDRVSTVRYSDGSVIKYAYTAADNLVAASNSTGSLMIAGYNTGDQVQVLSIDGEAYSFNRVGDEIYITNSKGVGTHVHRTEKDGLISFTAESIPGPAPHN